MRKLFLAVALTASLFASDDIEKETKGSPPLNVLTAEEAKHFDKLRDIWWKPQSLIKYSDDIQYQHVVMTDIMDHDKFKQYEEDQKRADFSLTRGLSLLASQANIGKQL